MMTSTGRIITIISAILSIIMVNGEWLKIYQVPLIFGDTIAHEYSLHNISEFLETFNMYFENAEVDMYSILSIGAMIITIINVIIVIFALINSAITKEWAESSLILSVAITILLFFAIYQINTEMDRVTHGGIKELLRTTSNPYCLIGFSVLSTISSNIKKKVTSDNSIVTSVQNNSIIQEKCNHCGAKITKGAIFCRECGSNLIIQTQNTKINIGCEKSFWFCSNCGTKLLNSVTICHNCKTPKNRHQTTITPTPRPARKNPADDFWVCQDCGCKNTLQTIICKSCGKYK